MSHKHTDQAKNSISDDDPLGLTGFDWDEPAVLASRGAFPPNDHFDAEEYYKLLSASRALSNRSKIYDSSSDRSSSYLGRTNLVSLLDRMRNGLAEVSPETRSRILKDEFGLHEKDTGGTEVQAALLTARIENLSKHLKSHPKDVHSKRGLIQMTRKRKGLLKYLAKQSTDRYRNLVHALGVRG